MGVCGGLDLCSFLVLDASSVLSLVWTSDRFDLYWWETEK